MTTQSAQARIAATYDSVPYFAYPFEQTHPDRLATIGTLLGLSVRPITKCRVLELGCSDGGNLLPMACQLPASEFVGIDLSGVAIERGNAIAKELGLKNLTLQQADLLAINADFGQFDYIIAHGLYSWIPPQVREKLLAICRTNLTANGIAYVSYNAYPGYHLWRMSREMMQFHTRDMADPEEKISQATSLLRFLSLNAYQQKDSKRELYQSVLTEHLSQIEQYRHAQQLFHDELSPYNDPVYFHEFVRQAGAVDLQFLAEANFYEMFDHGFPADARAMLAQFGDENILLREQYLDFLKGRTFRQTLLCRRENAITRTIDPAKIDNLYLATTVEFTSDVPDLRPHIIQKFTGKKGSVLQTDFPLAKAALLQLRQAWPQYVGFSELVAAAQNYLVEDAAKHGYSIGECGAEEIAILREIILAAYQTGIIQLHTFQPLISKELGTHPHIFPLARVQAQYQLAVANLVHKSVEIELPFLRYLLTLMDGTRDLKTLQELMVEWLKTNAGELGSAEISRASQSDLSVFVEQMFAEVLPQLSTLVLLQSAKNR